MENKGLTSLEVAKRVNEGKVNVNTSPKTKSYSAIVFQNVFSFFNLVNVIVALLILSTGVTFDTIKNVLFLFVALSNTALGIFQESRSKHTMDKLQIISSLKATVIRDGKSEIIPTDKIVLDDVIRLDSGNQVVADCVVTEGSVFIDESMLSGESDPVCKNKGDKILSGSFVISGACFVKAEKVGADCYASKITKESKRLRKNTSEIMRTLMLIIKVMTVINVPLGILLYISKVFFQDMAPSEVIISIGGSVIGMLPEGLVLLTTTVFTVTAMRLGLKRVLAQDMYSAESLARVDVLCLDKTGTLTTGQMKVEEVIPLCDVDLDKIMADFLYNSTDKNATASALREYFTLWSDKKCVSFSPFDSTKKYSSVTFENEGTYILGAADIISAETPLIKEKSKSARVLMLALKNEELKPLALFVLKDELRNSARQTLEYFEEQGVTVKVISGDNLDTVKSIAEMSGVIGYEKAVDMTAVDLEQIPQIVEENTVFARVTPEQKKHIILALKQHGHTVAMTGDGVNDVMALREADCSIAMAEGTDAAKNVSQLVLLDSNFDALPLVVKEGRRSINNLKRSASLFLVKTLFSLFLTVIFLFIPYVYPFEPIQLTLVSALCIGTPSVLLALEPNFERIKGRFLIDITLKSLPASLAYVIAVLLCTAIGEPSVVSTMCVIVAGSVSFMNLARVCMPFNLFRGALFATMLSAFIFSNIFLKRIFSLATLTLNQYLICAVLVVLVCLSYILIYKLTEKITKKEH